MNQSHRSNSAFRPPYESDEAIITSLIRFGEWDCIARLFCRRHGRLSVFVKNGLKSSKTRGGILQAPCRARVSIRVQPEKDLSKLNEIDVLPHSFDLASNLRSFGWACYLSELLELFMPEHLADEALFDIFDQAFLFFSKQKCETALLRAVELKLLAATGYLPDLSDSVEVEFDAEGWTKEVQKVAQSLFLEPLSLGRQIDSETLRIIGRIFSSQLKQVAKGPLKSVVFLKSMGV